MIRKNLGSAAQEIPTPAPIHERRELKTIKPYDPGQTPEPAEWLALDEGERIELVTACHRRMGEELPNLQLHAAFHVVVENQLAEGIQVVAETLARLVAEGLDRHMGIHAIGAVLAEHLSDLMWKGPKGPDPNEPYVRRLRSLTASRWMKDYG